MVAIDNISDIKTYVVNTLSNISPDITVSDGFPTDLYFGKPEKAILSVMVQNVTADHNAFNNYYGEATEQGYSEIYASKAKIVLGLYLSLPQGYTEAEINDIFINICNRLLFDDQYEFQQISCDEIKFDAKTQSLICDIKATTAALINKSVTTATITGFEVAANINY